MLSTRLTIPLLLLGMETLEIQCFGCNPGYRVPLGESETDLRVSHPRIGGNKVHLAVSPGPLAHRLCLVCDDANMRGVRCTDPDGETIIYRSARSVAEWIETVTGKAVSDYHVKTTASRNGELNGFQLSHATDEEQQLLRGGVAEPDEEVLAAGTICRDGAMGFSNGTER